MQSLFSTTIFGFINSKIMVKQKLDNAGARRVQADILALSDGARALALAQIRNDFNGWMLDRFDLAPSQVDQLYSLSDELRDGISTDLADSWEEGAEINFYKEEKTDDRGAKEIINSRRVPLDAGMNPDSASRNTVAQMSITIRYRYE